MQFNNKFLASALILILIGITVVCSGCITKENEGNTILLDTYLYQNAPRDPFTFCNLTSNSSVVLDGDLLTLHVCYGGGCEEHEFVLIGDGAFAESDPIQTHIRLSHNSNNDMCEAALGEQLVFDLSPLKEKWKQAYSMDSGSIEIWLDGWKPSILYEF